MNAEKGLFLTASEAAKITAENTPEARQKKAARELRWKVDDQIREAAKGGASDVEVSVKSDSTEVGNLVMESLHRDKFRVRLGREPDLLVVSWPDLFSDLLPSGEAKP